MENRNTPVATPTSIITPSDVGGLLSLFAKTPYDSRETIVKTQQVLNRCLELMQLDYKCLIVPNTTGELCSSYPNQLVIPECERDVGGDSASTLNHSAPAPAPQHPCPLSLASPSPQLPIPSFSSVVSRGTAAGGGGGGGGSAVMNNTAAATAAPTTTTTTSPPPPPPPPPPLSSSSSGGDPQTDGSKLRELILKAKFARCRARFPIPVILYKGNYICRSSTLAGGPEMYGRSGIEYLLTAAISGKADDEMEEDEVTQTNSDWQLFDRVRSQDIRLLKSCSVGVIVDLMVEKKKVKYGLNVTSSEKVDKENRYGEFSILSLPYPGCEFFREFRDSGYTADGLAFNWNQAFMDAQLVIPERSMSRKVTADWNSYRKWDLVRLTQNYLRLLLVYAHEGSEGLLVHCISGWDRTPLFISLLRLSLWADGLIHPSLGPVEILYFTIAYDWLLFGHDLKDRLAKGEEIFFFCFDFLKYITSEDFAVGKRRHPSSDSSGGGGGGGGGLLLLLEGDGLSPAGSSASLTSSCSSSRSAPPLPPRYFRADGGGVSGTTSGVHLTWPYGSDTSDLDLDDFSPRLSRASSASSTKGGLGRSHAREVDVDGRDIRHPLQPTLGGSSADVTRQSVSWSRGRNTHSESSGESGSGLTDEPPRASTSPVAVPVPRNRHSQPPARTRQESLSSVGSWQIISTTGSLRGSPGVSSASSSAAAAAAAATPQGSATSRSSHASIGSDLVDSACTVKESSSLGSDLRTQASKRPERLAKVRSVFYNQYVTAIGFTACNGRHDSGLGTLVSNFAQKVGIRPSPNRNT